MADKSVRTPALLVIMDGCGLAPAGPENAVSLAKMPYLQSLYATYPHTTLGASGEDVGLPDGQMGNSEVGHLNIGAGRIVFQELSRINNAVKDGSIKENEALVNAMESVKASGGCLHIMGLISTGGVHSSMAHAEALVSMAAERGLKKIRIDGFGDGRDVDPQSGVGFVEDLSAFLANVSEQTGTDAAFATFSGRYWGMDRDNRWERVEKAYNAIVCGEGVSAPSAAEGLKAFYAKDPRGDEFVDPLVIDPCGLNDGDAVIFFNFRPDRAREMTRAMMQKDFTGFDRKKVPALADFVSMTEYDPEFTSFGVHVAFPKTVPPEVLADVLSEHGLKQLHTAETEKYAHVTFFLNGGVEAPKDGETRVLVPSPKVATYDLQPEMSEPEVTAKLVAAINDDAADFYVVNYANCDMVGHTGVVEAAVKACEAVDDGLSKVIPAILAKGGFALITADHGNADHMYDVDAEGQKHPFTAHTTNRVPLIVADDQKPQLAGIEDGRLSDIAPTILAMMDVDRPQEMTGRVLVQG
ncbi:MAG: 2,3-bisphosphoglycerate-independent phosphoglycerate mutase [Atopobiaceae bacterium]|jgi:2,3-bisphosphoglycerate-independent phosphoglycerate mutase|nr:2,3-bisphosphoglycerate-independent phosphoglycerate mutase [Atopobiaceae bacterium]MCH4180764.1 2,3-bisphosphoglycerate-independent phosphoglycerate mutase [Atopobiaceae bacterium]MCH4214471.1 2,3-bisphosphoglycerate-independent phosphoglycerate mutase [Atopobiaceae bacterium]MCH4229401.1 2,3-bisphosphoglycerate-independent phosphoglycerate mutase [Atopobiaceae bacterium]MCH4276641.1 2,3-bisphosphoglycerate-independent phosphoglycerate mutase [Atopobiaceae bacterium]